MGLSLFVGGTWVVISLIGVGVLALGAATAVFFVRRLGGERASARSYLSSMPYATTAMLALFLGFMASDTWLENRRANDVAGMERLALERLELLAGAGGGAFEGLPRAIAAYRAAVIEQEWGGGRNVAPVQAVDDALYIMWRIALEARQSGDALAGDLVGAVDALAMQRETRLNIGRSHDDAPWLVVFVLAYFSCCVFAFAHLDRPAAAYTGLTLFVAMMVLVFVFLALFDGPYEGFALPPTILAR